MSSARTPVAYLSVHPSVKSRWELFKQRWKNCRLCDLYKNRTRGLVHVRGQIPADLVLIGEGPGESEDIIGYPFVGPAGKLLDEIMTTAKEEAVVFWGNVQRDVVNESKPPYTFTPRKFADDVAKLRIAYMTVVACIPLKDGTHRLDAASLREPRTKEISMCHPRTTELLDLIDPVGVVLVGKTAQKTKHPGRLVSNMYHPAALLKMASGSSTTYHTEYRRCVHVLREAIISTINEKDIPF